MAAIFDPGWHVTGSKSDREPRHRDVLEKVTSASAVNRKSHVSYLKSSVAAGGDGGKGSRIMRAIVMSYY